MKKKVMTLFAVIFMATLAAVNMDSNSQVMAHTTVYEQGISMSSSIDVAENRAGTSNDDRAKRRSSKKSKDCKPQTSKSA
ncbi:hypothetical protein A9264_13675 [Vibrio sp. UCD-FRSSP16_10]|uniref:hypothetical protein n=1 Tax=unclassified Vibrio TaxID=2614977 RepID=UPI0007FF1661|nr:MULTISPECIES: hypothetical protein [unclassified Vibrio]OBT13685.1 hypothetical protein A9260_14055 [Vibrio sp. UCD-FRSSP16_30]OBT20010.1 hypothetical protein A9264_13675 [Vibrio sp. UCD-FRSSP16_10]